MKMLSDGGSTPPASTRIGSDFYGQNRFSFIFPSILFQYFSLVDILVDNESYFSKFLKIFGKKK